MLYDFGQVRDESSQKIDFPQVVACLTEGKARKDCTSFLLLGVPILKIPSTLLGSIFIPSF
uniref:Uncharacterized protein n=1 Tax=Picea glauca TaxID=3330 RepID=A0A124GN93_PICGL|nr:hypothetical protein ABT39_MTgene5108 [Picea glauca]